MFYQEPLKPFISEDVPADDGDEEKTETPTEGEVKGDEEEVDESEEEL